MTTTPEATDRTFPALHGRPPAGWLNDPNGCGRIDGVWHVFYQYNPDAPVHDRIHWGHMTSRDLARWRTEDVALSPSPGGLDQAGCWTGCLVDDGGTPTLVYSAVAGTGGSSAVALARGDRSLSAFEKIPAPAIGMPADASLTDVRDPYVFTLNDRRYAVQGAGSPTGTGQILAYGCDDLTSWTELGTLLRADHPVVADVAGANIWECPCLVPAGDEWLLVVSVWLGQDEGHRLSHPAWILGDLADGDKGLRFEPRAAGRLDAGPAFYAPQVIRADGRTLMWGWSWELDRTPEEVERAGWAGVLTFPRELTVVDGRVRVAPIGELADLRAGEVDPAGPLPPAFEADWPDAHGVLLCRSTPCWPTDLRVRRVLVDGSLVEAFTDDGRSFTTRAYPTAEQPFRVPAGETVVTVHELRA